ncbi:hypothetical protein, partial [Streptococcus vestibularis]|uniref:hypothetical protein n=1 Tax=Streptococcus vestibularis TaxID=1343 RepID=UPI002900340E
VAFHYSSYGTFCVHSKSSIISTVVLPTTEIIEPIKEGRLMRLFLYVKNCMGSVCDKPTFYPLKNLI